MRLFPLAAAALIVMAGCHSSTEPPPATDVFVLMSVDGRPLPTTRSNDPSSNGATILSESLTLRPDGSATRRTTVQTATPSAPQVTVVSYAYTRNGDVVTLGNVLCGPGALCILHVPEEGSIVGDMLTLSHVPSLSSIGGSVSTYQRAVVVQN